MSIGTFLASSFLVLGSSMSPPQPEHQVTDPPRQVAQSALEQGGPAAGVTLLERNRPTNVQGIETVCTGIDIDTRNDPRWAEYPLRLEFTAGGRAYVAYEQVSITGAGGASVLDVQCPGAWLLAKLPAGKYQVTATVKNGATRNATVSVPSTGQARVVLRFPEVPAAESDGSSPPPSPPPEPQYQPVPN